MSSLTSESIPYTCAVLNETLRLYAPVGANVRKSRITSITFYIHCKKLFKANFSVILNRVAKIPKNTELEIAGIKFKNGFNVEIPYDLLHTHPGTDTRIIFFLGNREIRKF